MEDLATWFDEMYDMKTCSKDVQDGRDHLFALATLEEPISTRTLFPPVQFAVRPLSLS